MNETQEVIQQWMTTTNTCLRAQSSGVESLTHLFQHLDQHMNDLELGSDVKQEPEDNCVEPMNTGIQTILNTTSKPSTSQSSQEMVNKDKQKHQLMNGKSSEDSMEMPSKQLISKSNQKCCLNGSQVLRKGETFIRHLSHKTETEFRCLHNGCQYKTSYKPDLTQHVIFIHSADDYKLVLKALSDVKSQPLSEMPSKQCQRKCCLRKSETFISHFRCQRHWCQFKTSCKTDFTQHVRTHLQQHRLSKALSDIKSQSSAPVVKLTAKTYNEIKRCQWPGCQYMGPNLSSHKLVHNSVRPHACHWPQCGKRFNTKSGLKIHTNRHNNIKPFACDLPDCGQRFVTKPQLNLHTNKHNNVRPFGCDWPECGKRFTTKDVLKYHMNGHNNVKPYACDWPACEYRTGHLPNISKHLIQVHKMSGHKWVDNGPIQYPCDWPECGKQFTHKQTLKYHINVHKNVKPFACDWPECEFSMCTPAAAIIIKKLFACLWPECGKEFASKPTLTDHMNVHNNVKPYACDWPECEFRTHYAPNVRLHKKHVHKI
ncbi:unnamed protein product [Medioppia subpectinata]|uniref:C2H2-type domain-containing protein n=1 Tax=Medioppia subpectinata TaxID=1979941 RepID=A0A7R9KJM2_9ACAR|nr:unnamed protein product [Medioppia subpectinata]CAG2104612.1 unnamed protein product [Medioppia subpectinata]